MLSRVGGDCPKSQTFLSENRESAFGLVYGYGVFQSREDFSDSLGGGYGSGGKHHLSMTSRQGPSERRSRPRLKVNGARRGSGGKDSPNGAYRSDVPCRYNMPYIFVISKVVFDVIKI